MTDFRGLEKLSQKMREDILRSVWSYGRGHIGGALSVIDILVGIYLSGLFNFSTANSAREIECDSMILSKGHAGVALYAVLADVGFISAEDLWSINRGGLLAEHPSPDIPGVGFVSGSLGHGISLATGVALSIKIDGSAAKALVVVGDGELYEGTNWEAAQFAGHHSLSSLCVVIDRNELITHGRTEDILRLEDLGARWRSFGWEVRFINGHDHREIVEALGEFKLGSFRKPLAIIANTVKGKGVSFMENRPEWHHGELSRQDFENAIKELRATGIG